MERTVQSLLTQRDLGKLREVKSFSDPLFERFLNSILVGENEGELHYFQFARHVDGRPYMIRKRGVRDHGKGCLLYTSPSPRDRQKSRMPSSA